MHEMVALKADSGSQDFHVKVAIQFVPAFGTSVFSRQLVIVIGVHVIKRVLIVVIVELIDNRATRHFSCPRDAAIGLLNNLETTKVILNAFRDVAVFVTFAEFRRVDHGNSVLVVSFLDRWPRCNAEMPPRSTGRSKTPECGLSPLDP